MEKKTSYLGVIIFIIIFALVAVGTTFLLANFNKKDSNNGNVIEEQNKEVINNTTNSEKNEVIEVFLENDVKEPEKVVDESHLVVKNFGIETYFKNNLTIKEESYHEGEYLEKEFYFSGKEVNYPLQVNYIQIDGLKDKNIQEQINSDLKYKAINLAKSKDINAKIVAVDTIVEGNFSNILSVFIECGAAEKLNNNDTWIGTLRL